MQRKTLRTAAVAAALLAAVGLGACGDDGETASSSVDTTSTTAVGASFTATLDDYKFVGVPATAKVGTAVKLDNVSTKELHEFVAFKVPDGDTRSPMELLQDEAALGAPVMVLLAMPGSTETIPAVGNGTFTEPGRYVIMCSIPIGIEPAAYLEAAAKANGDKPHLDHAGPPHLTGGMLTEITIES